MLLDYITENDNSGTKTPNTAPVWPLLRYPLLGYLWSSQVEQKAFIKA